MNGRAFFLTIRARSLLLLVVALCFVVAWTILTADLKTVPASITQHVAGRIVVIDPGHGGNDPGAVAANGVLEKDVTLGVALHLERLLQRAAVNVRLTRRDDTDLADDDARVRKGQDLSRRVALGRETRADIFVSIHANSFPSSAWSGAQTFYFPNRSDDQWLAERIQSRLVAQLGPNRRQAAAADYYVMRESSIPSVVVEVGFLSHPRESELLGSDAYQRRVAEAIYMGIVDYFSQPRPVRADPPDASSPAWPVAATILPGRDEVLLYFVGSDGPSPVATVRSVPGLQAMALEERLDRTLRELLAGPRDQSLVSVVPDGVELGVVRFEDGTLHLDFNSRLRDAFTGGATEERLMIETLLLTVAQFSEVEWVRISIDGENTATIGGHVNLSDALPVPRDVHP